MARIFPLYDECAQKTDRVIPIILLTPAELTRPAATRATGDLGGTSERSWAGVRRLA
jgi:hypothetical protein